MDIWRQIILEQASFNRYFEIKIMASLGFEPLTFQPAKSCLIWLPSLQQCWLTFCLIEFLVWCHCSQVLWRWESPRSGRRSSSARWSPSTWSSSSTTSTDSFPPVTTQIKGSRWKDLRRHFRQPQFWWVRRFGEFVMWQPNKLVRLDQKILNTRSIMI